MIHWLVVWKWQTGRIEYAGFRAEGIQKAGSFLSSKSAEGALAQRTVQQQDPRSMLKGRLPE
jgi:hypothetical protein